MSEISKDLMSKAWNVYTDTWHDGLNLYGCLERTLEAVVSDIERAVLLDAERRIDDALRVTIGEVGYERGSRAAGLSQATLILHSMANGYRP